MMEAAEADEILGLVMAAPRVIHNVKVKGYRNLSKLRAALKRELNITLETSERKAA